MNEEREKILNNTAGKCYICVKIQLYIGFAQIREKISFEISGVCVLFTSFNFSRVIIIITVFSLFLAHAL